MDLVVGATGILGQEICRQLREKGREVRALVRPSSAPERVAALKQLGVQLQLGDLKQPGTLREACAGVQNVVTTASSTLSRADGDDLDSVDRAGNLSLIAAARDSGVGHFVLVSFAPNEREFPLQDKKREVERALAESGLRYTILQPPNFFDIWFSPALGFDAAQRSARVFGDGASRLHWVSSGDVAGVAVGVLGLADAHGQTLQFGGPHALSQSDVIAIFERVAGEPFAREVVPAEALHEQWQARRDPLEVSFAAMMLRVADGLEQPLDNASVRALISYEPLSIEHWARRVLARDA